MTVRGGDRFESALREIAAKLSNAKKVRIGFLENATYPDGKPVAMIAAIQEFGAPKRNIPPRPFFRNMISKEQKNWPAAIEQNLKATGYDARHTLELVGEEIIGQVKQSIVDTNSPPLRPRTIARKGFAKPLIDSSTMINSVDKEVT